MSDQLFFFFASMTVIISNRDNGKVANLGYNCYKRSGLVKIVIRNIIIWFKASRKVIEKV